MRKIITAYKGDMLFESKIGNHSVIIDVPDVMGGSDRGPQPPQLFVASLGSCIGAFVAQYCEKNGINAEGMTVEMLFEKAPDPTRLVNLKAQVLLPKADCSKRIRAIKGVAEHCPVHATINMMENLDIEILGEGECDIAAD
jgi:putative redox protein